MSDFIIENGILFKYTGSGGDIVIPDGVTEIGSFAFSGCEKIKSVTIPKSVVAIENCVFKLCKNLKDVVIPESVTEIGSWAFQECGSLENIVIPKSVEKIGEEAFLNCGNLKNVMLTKNSVEIGKDAFSGTPFLSSFGNYAIINNILFACFDDGKIITVPKEVETIAPAVFRNCEAEEIILPEGLKNIGEMAFHMCSNIKKAVIPKTVSKMGKYIFVGCASLEILENYSGCPIIKDGLRYWSSAKLPNIKEGFLPGEDLNDLSTDERALAINCYIGSAEKYSEEEKELYEAAILRQIKKLVAKAIEEKDEVKLVKLLERKKFPLKDVDDFIDKASKDNDRKVMAVLLDYKNKNYSEKDLNKEEERKIKEEFKPYSEETMKKGWKFQKNTELGGYKIMGYLGSDSAIEIPEQIGNMKVISISPKAFKGNKNLISVKIPNTVVSIGQDAFRGCKNLVDINIPENLEVLDKGAFCEIGKVKEFFIPEKLTDIGSTAFDMVGNFKVDPNHASFAEYDGAVYKKDFSKILFAPSKKVLKLSPKLKKIGNGKLFYEEIKEVYIPSEKTTIDGYAFFMDDDGESDVIVHAPSGSAAEEYTQRMGIKFEAI